MSRAWADAAVRRGWRHVRAFVLDRDGWRCTQCGVPVHDGCLVNGCPTCANVHHLDGVEYGHNPDRCVTLCAFHHRAVDGRSRPTLPTPCNGVHEAVKGWTGGDGVDRTPSPVVQHPASTFLGVRLGLDVAG